MTVSANDRRREYSGNGVTTVFNGPMAYQTSHILAYLVDDVTGVPVQQPGATFTVTFLGREAGTTVTMNAAPPVGQTLLLLREVPEAQLVDITNQGSFNASIIERQADLLAMQIQQVADSVNHKVGVPDTTIGVNTTLPTPSPTVLWGWDDTGLQARYYTLSELANFIAYGDKTYQVFTGNGVATSFPLGQDPGSLGNLDVSIDGITQVNGTEFTYSGTTLTFTTPPPNLSTILVRYDQAVPIGVGLASAINFQQEGAGAVVRSAQEKMREFLSVKDFGAIGDGVADDTAAFAAATATGFPAYVPYTTGFYGLSSLSDAQLELLWGPGVVKTAGATTQIPSAPRSTPNALAGVTVIKPDWQPEKWPTVNGSLLNAASYYDLTRTGGFGTYGSSMNQLLVTAALPAGQLDTVETAWGTATNMTGGQIFGSWFGANTPAAALGQTYSSGAVIGQEINAGNRWGDFGLQSDIGGTRYTVGMQVVADVLPAKDGSNDIPVTSITIASPGVVNLNSHGLPAWTGIVFGGGGVIPGGLVKGQLYYVSATGLTANTFQVASTVGGASINTTGAFSSTITIRPSYAGSFGTVHGQSVWAHRWWVGTLIRPDTIMAGGYANYHRGGTIASMAPAAWTKVDGNWARGLDMRGAIFSSHGIDFESGSFSSGAALNFDFTASSSNSATAGGIVSPGGFQGFLKFAINGNIVKVPYFQN